MPSGQGVGVVIAEEPPLVNEYGRVLSFSFGKITAAFQHGGKRLLSGQGVRMFVPEDAPLVCEHRAEGGFGAGQITAMALIRAVR